jgi:hypothetical protein
MFATVADPRYAPTQAPVVILMTSNEYDSAKSGLNGAVHRITTYLLLGVGVIAEGTPGSWRPPVVVEDEDVVVVDDIVVVVDDTEVVVEDNEVVVEAAVVEVEESSVVVEVPMVGVPVDGTSSPQGPYEAAVVSSQTWVAFTFATMDPRKAHTWPLSLGRTNVRFERVALEYKVTFIVNVPWSHELPAASNLRDPPSSSRAFVVPHSFPLTSNCTFDRAIKGGRVAVPRTVIDVERVLYPVGMEGEGTAEETRLVTFIVWPVDTKRLPVLSPFKVTMLKDAPDGPIDNSPDFLKTTSEKERGLGSDIHAVTPVPGRDPPLLSITSEEKLVPLVGTFFK